ncbi:MAG: heavy metal-binding domain-containing protein [Stygiobacter sp.]|jgi:Cu(I)/Ag(I) efflux system membrane fusion protein/cobalt-zinc-cadmium efflux system membrane fusion protein
MNTLKIFANIFLVAMFLLSSYTFAQGKTDSTKTKHKMMHHQHDMMKDSSMQHKMHNMKMMKDSTHQMMMENKKEMMGEKKSPLIREGEIDLESIDENKDGKVYQDVMDWNVISDKPGKCPLCNMKLKEVSLDKAKENLLKNGFKVK